MQDLNSFAKGKELFRNGLLSEAVLAFEAEVQRNASNVEAWRLLGTVHAENDDDQRGDSSLIPDRLRCGQAVADSSHHKKCDPKM